MINTSQRSSREPEKDLIPAPLLRLMFALVVASLALVSYAVYSGRPHIGTPVASPVVAERQIIIRSGGAQAVTLLEPDGTEIAHMDHGGFIAVIANGIDRARTVARVDPGLPVTLARHANGRLTVTDPATDWTVELTVFGADNEAAFAALLPKE